jgi:DNA-binding transcriptional ArsR family regulator
MAGAHEDEIYSTMFTSLKHPVRRKILRMLGNKSMTFMEMVEELGISSPNLTYHLESLGELVSKMDNDQYKLSSFGLATINAMKGIEEIRETEPKRRSVTFKWRAVSAVLLVAVLLLSGMAALQYTHINDLTSTQQSLTAENQDLMSYGGGTDKVPKFLQNVTKIDIQKYTISLLSNTMQWRTDFGGVNEEVMQYALANSTSNLNVDFRFRNNHFSRYQLDMIESSPIFTQLQPNDVIQNAKYTLARYRTYSGDDYLTNMSRILDTVGSLGNMNVTQGNIKLEITVSAGTVVFFWMYTENGIDYQAKGLQMTFQNNVLTTMTDGYFLFTVSNTKLAVVSQEQAVSIAEDYVKTLTWNIEGKSVSNFTVVDPPLSVQMVPHTRGNSVALIPYWYVEMRLGSIYAGGINEVTVGIYADSNQVADVQMLSTIAGTET